MARATRLGASKRPRSLTILWLACVMLHPLPVGAQTIDGRLLDANTRRPISLGVVTMLSEAGDAVASSVTSREGSFSVSSGEPGSFFLVASAFGYGVTPDGVYELGDGGRMSVEFRVAPEPLRLEELVVSLRGPAREHPLVRNGFVRRHQSGLGQFLTPRDIELSPAESTELLLEGMPGVDVRTIATIHRTSERVRLLSSSGDPCDPRVYVDGARLPYDFDRGDQLSDLVPLPTVDAVEVYRRSSEIPTALGIGTADGGRGNGIGVCGLLLFWTKLR